MKIKVKPFYAIKEALKSDGILELETDKSTIRELLEELALQYGGRFSNEIFNDNGNEIDPQVKILVNGLHYHNIPNQLDYQLKNNDIVAIFPSSQLKIED